MEKQIELGLNRTRNAIYLRFKDDEFERLTKIAKSRGQKLQHFIKSVVLSDNVSQPLFSNEMSQNLATEIKRIGNNFNQIAKKLNSGFRRDWYDSFENCANDLDFLRRTFLNNVRS